MPSAYLLVSHGSRDPRPEIAMQQLAELICHKVQKHSPALLTGGMSGLHRCPPLVGTAYLELNPKPLHEQIQNFGEQAIELGFNRLKIIPLFLLPGVHVMEDIPIEVRRSQQNLSQKITLDLQPYLGSHPGLAHLLGQQFLKTETEARILIAHGSRRPGFNGPVEAIASTLKAVTAYWAVPPCLEVRVKELITAGSKQIAILPYFLFPGGITDAIAHQCEELKLQFPEVSFRLTEPLGVSAELANLIWDLVEK